jgi:hypothetical protein
VKGADNQLSAQLADARSAPPLVVVNLCTLADSAPPLNPGGDRWRLERSADWFPVIHFVVVHRRVPLECIPLSPDRERAERQFRYERHAPAGLLSPAARWSGLQSAAVAVFHGPGPNRVGLPPGVEASWFVCAAVRVAPSANHRSHAAARMRAPCRAGMVQSIARERRGQPAHCAWSLKLPAQLAGRRAPVTVMRNTSSLQRANGNGHERLGSANRSWPCRSGPIGT